jgi:hypothetical protein
LGSVALFAGVGLCNLERHRHGDLNVNDLVLGLDNLDVGALQMERNQSIARRWQERDETTGERGRGREAW